MEVVCIDFLCLKRSKGGFENILVLIDHYTRYTQAIPTQNQTAQTTANALYEKFFVHYGRRVAEIQIFEKTYLIVIKDETGLKFKMSDSTLFLIGSYAQKLVASY